MAVKGSDIAYPEVSIRPPLFPVLLTRISTVRTSELDMYYGVVWKATAEVRCIGPRQINREPRPTCERGRDLWKAGNSHKDDKLIGCCDTMTLQELF